jgi:hypothetical protein
MENNKEKGPFGGDDLDPIVFVNSDDTPELRDAALLIPRPMADEDGYSGPKISRKELMEEKLKSKVDDNKEWVPNLEEDHNAILANRILEYTGRIIIGLIPLSLAGLFILLSAGLI